MAIIEAGVRECLVGQFTNRVCFAGGHHEISGLVGGQGTFTPLRQMHELPAAAYDISFEAEVYPPVRLGVWPVDFDNKKPVSIAVGTGIDLGR